MDSRERIFALLAESGMEQKAFAAQIGVIPQTVTDWKNQKSKSYTKYIPQIADAFGTTTEYLLTGEGPKNKTAPTNVPDSGIISEEALKVAYFRGADPTLTQEDMDALWQDAKNFRDFIISNRKRKSNEEQPR